MQVPLGAGAGKQATAPPKERRRRPSTKVVQESRQRIGSPQARYRGWNVRQLELVAGCWLRAVFSDINNTFDIARSIYIRS